MRELYNQKEYCFGCGACLVSCPSQAIKMERDEEGFLYPVVLEELCKDCGKCLEVCPAQKKGKKDFGDSCFYGFQIRNRDILKQSASGGAFSALAALVFKKSRMDNADAVVYGASMREDGSVHHKGIWKEEDLCFLRNSKYVESSLDQSFEDIIVQLKEGHFVMFSGTPCQVQGLKHVLREFKEETFWKNKLLLVDIICNGVGSPYAWEHYLRYLEKAEGQIVKSYTFRDKSAPRGYAVSWRVADGSEKTEGLLKNRYWCMYQKGFLSRPSCYNCPYAGLERCSDVTIGDFHGLEDKKGVFSVDEGVSVVIANTEKGKKFCQDLESEGTLEKYSVQEILQPRLQTPAPKHPLRKLFLKDMKTMPHELFVKKYGMMWGEKKG